MATIRRDPVCHMEIVIHPDCSTRAAGLFAAGDVTAAYGKRVLIACGEGAKAALSAYKIFRRKLATDTALRGPHHRETSVAREIRYENAPSMDVRPAGIFATPLAGEWAP